jgi:nicotinate-nucleotide adenylyltransferase
MKVAIFGGSFNPIHKGHLEIIDKLAEMFEKVIVIPNYQNPLKTEYVPANIRYEWLKKSITNPKVEVSNYEISQKKVCYTIDTINYFKQFYDKISFVIGADNLATLHKWKDITKLKELVEFVVVTRDNIEIGNYKTIKVNIPISSTKIRDKLDSTYLPDNLKTEILNYYKRKKMEERLKRIVEILDNKKALDIETFNLLEKEYFVDGVVIATTMGQKHGFALLDELKRKLKPQESFLFVDESDDWIVVDLGDILIHLMSEEYRAKYQLEEFLNSYVGANK